LPRHCFRHVHSWNTVSSWLNLAWWFFFFDFVVDFRIFTCPFFTKWKSQHISEFVKQIRTLCGRPCIPIINPHAIWESKLARGINGNVLWLV
jgi:hypothetical protein